MVKNDEFRYTLPPRIVDKWGLILGGSILTLVVNFGWLNYDMFVSNWLNSNMAKLKMRQKTFEQKQKERWEDYERMYGKK